MISAMLRAGRIALGLGACFAFAACCTLEIVSNDLPVGKVGEQYNYQFDADCDDDRWELVEGTPPPGLSLGSDGELTGVPGLAGIYTMTIGVGGQGDASDDFTSKGFVLNVIQPVGTLEITTSTTGTALDPDGYFVFVGTEQYSIGINEALIVPDVPVGTYTVALSGNATNCTPQGGSTQSVTVLESQTTAVSFQIVCAP